MVKANNKTINAAIKKATGYDVKVFCAEGCCRFYSDDEVTAEFLQGLHSFPTVYVCYISHLTVEEWVYEFTESLKSLSFAEKLEGAA